MEEEVTVVNQTKKNLKAEMSVIICYREKWVYAGDNRVFSEIYSEPVKREIRITIKEPEEEKEGE